ncbi:hypothetical protein NP493_2017g00010 [Ridgeia piscesae]|uniref:Reverse transcriptase domain-containing protein n=1 Tax=Ridgeia piscesae TaxID=27915 RepID=A0AAD9JMR9_RIDPI|nr:hypothetical protein NP493_2017g00010 [Ridgeia piscesae]
MYKSIKSCVMNNGVQSEFFDSHVGLRQGEHLSPLLFALFLNDMETFFPAQKWNTLKCIDKLYNDSNDGINGMLNLFVLLYVHWVFNFLRNRPQCVRVGDIKSPVLVSNTGAPQGCVLSPFLYTLYTNDCRSVDSSTQFVRFSDDTAMLALLNDFASYQSYLSSVVRFSSWCSKTFLHLNVSKTKEMCIDFRRNRTVVSPIVINGEPVEQLDSFKYLGVILDEKLSFTEHVTAVQKKSQQRLHVLRKLRAFYVDPLLLLRLYRSIIEPLLTYCSICYYPALSVKNCNRLLKISRFCQDHWFTYTKAL